MARLKMFYLINTSSKNFDNKELFSKFRRMVEPRASEHSTLTRGAVQVEKIFRNTKGVQ